MKKTFATLILTSVVGFGFAQESIPALANDLTVEKKPAISIEEKIPSQKGFTYVRMGMTDSFPTHNLNEVKVLPSLGLGYRYAMGASAVDVSASYSSRSMPTEEGRKETYSYTLPKVNCLYYASPVKNNSFYAGAGVAFAGQKTKNNDEFDGFVPNVAVGYEMNRNQSFKSFVQLEVGQPAYAVRKAGELPGPTAELAFGAGF